MHVPESKRERAFRILSELLNPSGMLVISLRHGQFSHENFQPCYLPMKLNGVNSTSCPGWVAERLDFEATGPKRPVAFCASILRQVVDSARVFSLVANSPCNHNILWV